MNYCPQYLLRVALCSSVGPSAEHFGHSPTYRTSSMYCISNRDGESSKILFSDKEICWLLIFFQGVFILIQILFKTQANNKSFFFFFGNAISDFSSWKRVREICASSVLEHDHFSLVGNQNILNYKQNKSLLRWKTFIENVLHFSNSSKASLFCYTSGYLHNLNQCYLLFRACKIIKFLCEKR